MRTNYKEAIRETVQQLADLEKSLRRKPTAARIRMLRLLKSGQARSLQTCAPLVGYSRIQLTRWWKQYTDEGIEAVTIYRPRFGKRSQLTTEAFNDLKQKMREGRIARLEGELSAATFENRELIRHQINDLKEKVAKAKEQFVYDRN